MPIMKMLPLGTVIKPKDPKPGWGDLRYIITGYFPRVLSSGATYDYVATPWPLGIIKIEGGGEQRFYSCNESAIESIEFFGAVSAENASWIDNWLQEALSSDKVNSPLASGEVSVAVSLGDSPCTLKEGDIGGDRPLPLGTVVSESLHPGRKAMIYQHSGVDSITGNRFDYCVCPWPQGANPGDENIYVLNQDQITAVHFRGYENALSQELAKRLEKKRKGSLFSRIIGKAR